MKRDPKLEALLELVLSSEEAADRAARAAAGLPSQAERPISSDMTGTTIIDAKIAASEARTDTKFAKLEGKLDLILNKVDRLEGDSQRTRATVRNTGLTLFFGLASLMVAISALAFNGFLGSFNAGVRVRDIVREEVVAARPAPAVAPVSQPATK